MCLKTETLALNTAVCVGGLVFPSSFVILKLSLSFMSLLLLKHFITWSTLILHMLLLLDADSIKVDHSKKHLDDMRINSHLNVGL